MASPSWCAPLRCGLITGLVAEARVAAPLGDVAAGGGLPDGATAAAERLVAAGASALVSFGLCGGLDPALPAGALVLPRGVLTDRDAFYRADAALLARLGGATCDWLLAGAAIAGTAAAKRQHFAQSAAAAIDLESGAVAAVAARHGLPFAALRAVCDPAALSLPPAALLALDAQGGIGLWRVAGSVLAAPGQLPALLALARAAAAARAALVRRVAEIVDRHAVGGGLVP